MRTPKPDLVKLRRLQARYMAHWKGTGRPWHAYLTPCCGKTMETSAPSSDDTWDSLTMCEHCGALHMKLVSNEGVLARIPQA